jgi:hypothetical protein
MKNTKILVRIMKKGKSTPIVLIIGLFALTVIAPLAGAQQSSGVISRGFRFNQDKGAAATGAIVSARMNSENTVELATAKTSANITGVVDNQSLVAISSNNEDVQIVLDGTTAVLVSDINGPINAGDKITISPIAGVGMMANDNGQIVGTALTDFSAKSAQTKYVKDNDGVSRAIRISTIPVQVDVSYYQIPGSNILPPFLQNIANSIAGRPVPVIRILAAAILLIFGFVYTAVLIYTSVRTSVISIGRNPLAGQSIRRNLLNMSLLSVAILSVALLGTYLMLAV